MDQTRTDQSEQDRTELNENKPAWSRASLTRPMQTKANTQDLGKQNRATRSDLTRYIRTTKPGQYRPRQTGTDRNDQTDETKTKSIRTDGQVRKKPYQANQIEQS